MTGESEERAVGAEDGGDAGDVPRTDQDLFSRIDAHLAEAVEEQVAELGTFGRVLRTVGSAPDLD